MCIVCVYIYMFMYLYMCMYSFLCTEALQYLNRLYFIPYGYMNPSGHFLRTSTWGGYRAYALGFRVWDRAYALGQPPPLSAHGDSV